MIRVTYDFETYWSQTHSLSKMSPITYVLHPETEVQSVAVKVDDGESVVLFGEDNIRAYFSTIDWSNAIAIAHNNSEFDAMILAWRFGIRPKLWACTMAMARPIYAKTTGLSLDSVMKALGCPFTKGSLEEVNTKGKKLAQFTPDEIEKMRVYNKIDTDGCAWIFKRLAKVTPKDELLVIDATIRMLVEPEFECDVPMLEQTLEEERARKFKTLLDVATLTGAYQAGMTDEEAAEAARKMLASGPKFAQFMRDLGYEPPMKPSPSNPEKQTYALAKTDESFIALQDHDDPLIAAAASARLGVKSTILETRIEKFLEAAKYCGGRLPMPLKYYGADTTGRWSGFLFNPQNLPRVNPKDPKPTDALRRCMRAPKGKKVVVADLSGIELRVNMFLWKVPYAMELFALDPEADLYKPLASEVLGVPLAEITKMQRQAGKAMHLGCFSADTMVLTRTQVKRIVDVLDTDLVWDGEQWVSHSGIVYQGMKPTISHRGVQATTDHEILTEHGWQQWGEVCKNPRLYQSALKSASLPYSNGNLGPTTKSHWGTTLMYNVLAVGRGLLTGIISRKARLLGATLVQSKLRQSGLSVTGSTLTSYQTTSTERGFLTGLAQLLVGVTATLSLRRITGIGVSQSTSHGGKIVRIFWRTLLPSMVGTLSSTKWIESTMTKGMSLTTLGLCQGQKTPETVGQSPLCSEESGNSKQNLPVYDLLNCGPKNRFTVISTDGPLIVHNCGFGLGTPSKYVGTAKQMAQIRVTEDEAKVHIQGYRRKHPEIVQGWKTCHAALPYIKAGEVAAIDPWQMCFTSHEGITTPAGVIRYPQLRTEEVIEKEQPTGKMEWWYGTGNKKDRIYAGKIDENIVQHLARGVIVHVMLEVFRKTGVWPKLTVHDELVYLIDEDKAEAFLEVVQSCMRAGVPWWPELVTWSEGDVADTYGDAK